MQCSQVLSLSLSVVQEYVIEGAVDDGVEPIFEPVEACRIRDRKSTDTPARCALRLARSIAAGELSIPVVA